MFCHIPPSSSTSLPPTHGREQGQDRQERLLALLQNYMLKRMKNVVLKDALPTKRDKIVFCRLSDLQLRVYRRVLELVGAAPDCQIQVDVTGTIVRLSSMVQGGVTSCTHSCT